MCSNHYATSPIKSLLYELVHIVQRVSGVRGASKTHVSKIVTSFHPSFCTDISTTVDAKFVETVSEILLEISSITFLVTVVAIEILGLECALYCS